jgi:hypothetical membrane protein
VSDLGENVQSQIYIYNIIKIYIRLIVVSYTVQILYIRIQNIYKADRSIKYCTDIIYRGSHLQYIEG